MGYELDFGALAQYTGLFLEGAAVTLGRASRDRSRHPDAQKEPTHAGRIVGMPAGGVNETRTPARSADFHLTLLPARGIIHFQR